MTKGFIPFAVFVVCAQVSGCGGDRQISNGDLQVWNRSQFEIHALCIGRACTESPNLLSSSLAQESVFRVPDFPSGRRLTVTRAKAEVGNEATEMLHITTDAPLKPERDGATLIVFDTGFRLLPPGHPDGPPADVKEALTE